MGSSVLVVELSELCVWCGIALRWVGGGTDCWVHVVSPRSGGGVWCPGGSLHVATPTEWVDAIEDGFLSPAQARAAMGW